MDILEMLNRRIADHEKDLLDLDAYIQEQTREEDKVIPRRAIQMIRAYLEEDTALKIVIQQNHIQ